jgi:bifunctional non-homologous end joining protein LigD
MFRLRPRRPLPSLGTLCLPSAARHPPSGPDWIHEIKHDGYRLLARREGAGMQLLTRNGIDWSDRFPLIAAAVTRLPVRSCLIDGEAVVCDRDGVAIFEALRCRRGPAHLVAFDLIELEGRDLRQEPLEVRKRALTRLIGAGTPGLAVTAVFEQPGEVVFKQACALGCEGTVSKRRGSYYRSGRTDDWRKCENPDAPAGERELAEDWGQ